ncbi:DUF3050 domain-containing protein [Halochromatium glycolicum]|uniref:Heme oxygenase n=1 Tax=Halochromatium glycolicum TaxID=85075 RepID=A0AAJ0XB21_9GAMM|nr:DUF3050 domain-containing protein [Halochromatium glycolicum]MBK1705472.1 heme oxygenase [Halochromatium glycolicum]
MAAPDLTPIQPLIEELNQHPIYSELKDIDDLRVFMSHHAFSVWDFMSLIKYLQATLAPTEVPWVPRGDAAVRYFINQLTLEEESDSIDNDAAGVRYSSHFEFYCRAMHEIGADGDNPKRFIALVEEQGLDAALYSDLVPLPSRYFTETTFCFIREDKPHAVAAALAVGRERVIPQMFRSLLDKMGITAQDAPAFHHYLNRHIHLDEDFHGPLSMSMLDQLCGDDPERLEEATIAAEEAICARIRFWDGVLEAVRTRRGESG